MSTATTLIAVSETALAAIEMVRNATQKSPNGVSFFSIKNYENEAGEISDYIFNIGASFAKAKEKDIKFLTNMKPEKMIFKSARVEIIKAQAALLEAFMKPNEARSNGQKDAYTVICNNVKVHNETGVVYIFGLKVSKKVKVEGTYKKVNSSALTIAKDEIRKLLKTNNFRQFAISIGNTLTANGETIEIEAQPRARKL